MTADPPTRIPVRREAWVGLVLLGWSLLAGVAVARYPGPNALDHWGFSVVKPSFHSAFLPRITELGSLPVVAAGSILAGLAVFGHDKWRAGACLCGPLIAASLVEWVIKPVVARRYVGVLTFPSGTVTVVAGLSAAWALAVPRCLRWVVISIGTLLVALTVFAVIGLRWHYPSDAIVGAVFGVGVVLTLDGILHLKRRTR
jgi:membrane-associated phospholipid phosphatase